MPLPSNNDCLRCGFSFLGLEFMDPANAMMRGLPYPLQRGHCTSRSATRMEASWSRGSTRRISAKLAVYFWIRRVARYCHLRTPAPAQIGIARPPAEHCNRGVPRNRRTQHIDVGCGAHDGAAQRHPVRTTLELNGAGRDFPLGGLGLRSHARRGADHRCDRNYSKHCHVVPPLFGRLPASLEIKQAGSMLRNRSKLPLLRCPRTIPRLRLLVACPLWVKSRHSHCNRHVRLTPKADIRIFIDFRSCPLGLPVPEQAVVVPAVMELSEPGQVSECVFSTLPFSRLRRLHPLLLSRRGTALCLLGFLRHVQYPDQNYAATAQPLIVLT